MTLDQLKIGQFAELDKILDSPLTLNFLEIGLSPGKKIQIIQKAPFKGPVAVLLENQTIAIRLQEAKLLKVKI
ncbi:FeoA family protein [Litoribacter populi]|uniref:FeoA family protein n=1 Tax=Litoribacter populi TaxID=2598460 RepID=UPI00117F9094|nr:FeoA family protein [Litoribacter populi]